MGLELAFVKNFQVALMLHLWRLTTLWPLLFISDGKDFSQRPETVPSLPLSSGKFLGSLHPGGESHT